MSNPTPFHLTPKQRQQFVRLNELLTGLIVLLERQQNLNSVTDEEVTTSLCYAAIVKEAERVLFDIIPAEDLYLCGGAE